MQPAMQFYVGHSLPISCDFLLYQMKFEFDNLQIVIFKLELNLQFIKIPDSSLSPLQVEVLWVLLPVQNISQKQGIAPLTETLFVVIDDQIQPGRERCHL